MRRFFYSLAIAIVAMLIAESVTSEDAKGQFPLSLITHQPRDYFHNVRPNGTEKLEPGKRWVQPYAQLEQYDAWWKEIAKCLELDLDIDKAKHVRFVFINSATFHRAMHAEQLYGLADPEGMTIYLSRSMSENHSVVMHEMAHMLNAWNGVIEGEDYHPADSFEVCGLHTVYP